MFASHSCRCAGVASGEPPGTVRPRRSGGRLFRLVAAALTFFLAGQLADPLLLDPVRAAYYVRKLDMADEMKARQVLERSDPVSPPALLVAPGETTVTVTGPGRGGRNQEVALSAASAVEGIDGVVIGSIGTDGRDGPTDAAGGLIDGGTVERLHAAGISLPDALAANASYDALRATGDLLVTGPTLTNVADIALVAVGDR